MNRASRLQVDITLPVIVLCVAISLAGCKRPANESDAAPPAASTNPAVDAAPAKPATPEAKAEPAKPAIPSLKVETIDGAQYDLSSRRGQWVVVNFWATWCSPCLKEMPELSALDAMREHISVIGLAYEEIEPAALRAFLEKHPVAYPVAIVDVYEPPADFEVPRGLPMTYLIAPDGTVARRFLGPVTAQKIEKAIARRGGPEPAA